MDELLLPVNRSAHSLNRRLAPAQPRQQPPVGSPSAPAVASVDNGPTHPTADKLSTWEQESYQLSADLAVNLGFPVFSADVDSHFLIMLFGVSRYSEVVWQNEVYRYGVSIRVMLEIFANKIDFALTLPVIAAKVQLNDIQASSQLLIRGFVGDISAELPSWQSFNVDTYGDYMKSINDIQKAIFSQPDKILPELLSTTSAQPLYDPAKHVAKRGGLWARFHPFERDA